MQDRIVHATSDDGLELVRYDKAGKWYIEPLDKSLPRQKVTIYEAVTVAIHWEKHYGSVVYDQPGGNRFNQLIRREP